MIESSVFFYLTLAAAAFYVVSALVGGRRFGRSRGARVGRGAGRSGGARGAGRGGRAVGRGGRSSVFAMLSLNSAILFVGGFGIGGFFASTAGCGPVATIAAAVATGAVVALLDAIVLGALVRRQSSSATRMADFVGFTGTVEISISEGGLGRVRCRRGGDTVHLLARAADGAIPVNSVVRVLAIDGGIAVVRPAGELDSVPQSWRQ